MMIYLFCLLMSVAQASETVKGIEKDFDSVKKELNVQLDAAEEKLRNLKSKVSSKATDSQKKAVAEAERARDRIRASLDDLKDDGKKGWQKTRQRLAKSIDDLNARIQKALSGE